MINEQNRPQQLVVKDLIDNHVLNWFQTYLFSGGEGGHPDPEMRRGRGGSKKIFSAQFGLEIGGPRASPLDPPLLLKIGLAKQNCKQKLI